MVKELTVDMMMMTFITRRGEGHQMNKDTSEYQKEVIKDREGQKKGDRDMVK